MKIGSADCRLVELLIVDRKQVKVGVNAGAGNPPCYQWSIWILDLAFKESEKLFDKAQYEHLAMQVQELARHESPTHSQVLSIDKIESFFELREKGGVLGAINVRLFFGIDKTNRAIVVLGVILETEQRANAAWR